MTVRLKTDISLCPTEHSAVVLNERTGQYWQLNETGAEILELLVHGTAADDIAGRLADRRTVSRERALTDVRSLVGSLTAAGLIEAT